MHVDTGAIRLLCIKLHRTVLRKYKPYA